GDTGGKIALPPLRPVALRSLALLGIPQEKILTVGLKEPLKAMRLTMTDVMFALSARKAPVQLRAMIRELAEKSSPGSGAEIIYVSRLDAKRRRMANEPKLISRLAELGVSVVSMTGLTLDEQISH